MNPSGAKGGREVIGALALELLETLLDQIPRAPFFVKDRSLKYVAANAAMVELCGVQGRGEIIGRTAQEFFPKAASKRYERMDRQVISTGRPIKDQLELTLRSRGAPTWLLFGRWPVVDAEDQLVGVAALARNLEAPDRRHPAYERLASTMEHIQSSFGAPLDIAELARRQNVSVSQLRRDFTSVFGISPSRYLANARLEGSLEMLRGAKSIAEIAHACGYHDHGAFTARFRTALGVTPTEYRRSQHLKSETTGPKPRSKKGEES